MKYFIFLLLIFSCCYKNDYDIGDCFYYQTSSRVENYKLVKKLKYGFVVDIAGPIPGRGYIPFNKLEDLQRSDCVQDMFPPQK